jgi:hypothetical protein
MLLFINTKYLLEFESNFISSIKKIYGEDFVLLDENKGEITVITN